MLRISELSLCEKSKLFIVNTDLRQCCVTEVEESEEERRIEDIMGSGNREKIEKTRKISKKVTQADRNEEIK